MGRALCYRQETGSNRCLRGHGCSVQENGDRLWTQGLCSFKPNPRPESGNSKGTLGRISKTPCLEKRSDFKHGNETASWNVSHGISQSTPNLRRNIPTDH